MTLQGLTSGETEFAVAHGLQFAELSCGVADGYFAGGGVM